MRSPLGSEVVKTSLDILIIVVHLFFVERPFHRKSLQSPLQSQHVLLATVTIQSLISDVLDTCITTVTMFKSRASPRSSMTASMSAVHTCAMRTSVYLCSAYLCAPEQCIPVQCVPVCTWAVHTCAVRTCAVRTCAVRTCVHLCSAYLCSAYLCLPVQRVPVQWSWWYVDSCPWLRQHRASPTHAGFLQFYASLNPTATYTQPVTNISSSRNIQSDKHTEIHTHIHTTKQQQLLLPNPQQVLDCHISDELMKGTMSLHTECRRSRTDDVSA